MTRQGRCTTNVRDTGSCRPSTSQFRQKLPWFLNALPTANCAKGGHGAYMNSVDTNGIESLTVFACRYIHMILFGNCLAAREFNSRVSDVSQMEIFPYSVFYIFFEQYWSIWKTVLINLYLALGVHYMSLKQIRKICSAKLLNFYLQVLGRENMNC
ncbi:hypothetical protein H6P81_018274 [Aristolochia fimbriata]|uniref:Uncharacterized protein n=1 Tax=Aristolochia fimbriata TaxID=158543 RepID=A0AAV7E2M8_ARIFI|nr:hypothetical protein H6P81_018274 [Aristolochia fimbriata]